MLIRISSGSVEFRWVAPYFVRDDRYVRELRKGGDFKFAAHFLRNGGGGVALRGNPRFYGGALLKLRLPACCANW